MRIRDFASQNNLSYSKVYRDYLSGKIDGYKDQNGQIIIGQKPSEAAATPVLFEKPLPVVVNNEPVSTTLFEIAGSTRSNRAATQNISDRFKHIENALLPFSQVGGVGYGNTSDISVRDAIILCQKAYYNFSIFRTTIDLMTEFCVGKLHFKGGSSKVKKFFQSYCKKLKVDWEFQDMFYREFFRSGNNFIYRIEGEASEEEIQKFNQVFGHEIKAATEIPIRYVILNPADIMASGNISFTTASYYKLLTDYELERLRNPRTLEDQEVLNSLSPTEREQVQDKKYTTVKIMLDNRNIISVFYKKQSYDAFAVPMGYPVLEDINFKKELKLIDQAVGRTVQQAILLITMGAEPDKGGINPKAMLAMQKMFENESVARVVIADYTTKAEFLIPQIADILDPKKYEIVDKDIAIGLNNVLVGQGEKFANQHSKIEIFIERLKHARQAFINTFLEPEIKRVAQKLGFKNYPEPYYEDIDLKNDIEYAKIYSRLCELGILTAEETIKAIETGTLPTPDESEESQNKFKDLKGKGLYEPLLGKKMEGEGAGRPGGTKAPKSSVKISPIGGETNFSLTKIKENLLLATKLSEEITNKIKKKFKAKQLKVEHEEVVNSLTNLIIANEEKVNWISKIDSYLENPISTNKTQENQINEIAAQYNENYFNAAILFHSQINS